MSLMNAANHDRGRTRDALVYPVFSRRSRGLSVGINLFPDRKFCNFDCPYCEVLPPMIAAPAVVPAAGSARDFDLSRLEADLETFFTKDYPAVWAPEPVRDLCFSGNGEPALSPHLEAALELCARMRRRHAPAARADIVIITNGTGFLDEACSAMLHDFALRERLAFWVKLDSGSQEGFSAYSRSAFDIEGILAGIARFASKTPVVIQTMVCGFHGRMPGEEEARDYARRLDQLLDASALIDAIHLYTLARMPAEDFVVALGDEQLLDYANRVRSFLRHPEAAPVTCFGSRGAIERPA
jgi:histidinol dehydrogenase